MTGIAPATASAVERGLDETSAARIAAVPASLPETAWDAARIPVEWLPALAWALSVDIWDPDWGPELQRAAIADAYAQHRLKGTPAGVKRALDSIGAVYEIEERPGGVAFTESIEILNLEAITLRSEAELTALLGRVKRASVHLTVSARSGAGLDVSVGIGADAAALPVAAARLAIEQGSGDVAIRLPVHADDGTRISWQDLADGLGDLSSLRATQGAAHLIRLLFVGGNDDTTNRVRVDVARQPDGSLNGTGPELSDAWEGYGKALTIRVPGLTDLVVAGPNHADVTLRDAAEPYVWAPGANYNTAAITYVHAAADGTLSRRGVKQWVADFRTAYAADNSLRATAIFYDGQ